MTDAVKATFLFLRNNIFAFFIFCIAGGGLFLTILLMNYDAKEGFRSSDDGQLDTQSRYTFETNRADVTNIQSLILDMKEFESNFDCLLVGTGVTAHLWNDASLSSRLWAFYPRLPEFNEDLFIDNGALDFTAPDSQIMLSTFMEYDLMSMVLNDLPNDSSERMSPMEMVGEIVINESSLQTPVSCVYTRRMDTRGFIVDFSHFFDLSPTCDTIIVQFYKPLSKSQEDTFLGIVARNASVISVELPYQYSESTVESYKQQTQTDFIQITICMIGIFFLFQFLFQLRKTELNIMRLVGATRIYIQIQMIIMLFLSAVVSLLFGLAATGIMLLVSPVSRWLKDLSGIDVAKSVFQLVLALVISAVVHLLARRILDGRMIKETQL